MELLCFDIVIVYLGIVLFYFMILLVIGMLMV